MKGVLKRSFHDSLYIFSHFPISDISSGQLKYLLALPHVFSPEQGTSLAVGNFAIFPGTSNNDADLRKLLEGDLMLS